MPKKSGKRKERSSVTRSWKKLVSVILVLLILVTGFSRNYLGVHTPQDVIVGLRETVILMSNSQL